MSLPGYIEGLDLSGINLNDHHSLHKDIVSLNVAFMTLVVLVTGIRMSIRLFMIHAAGLDDWLMLLATLFTILLCAFSLIGAHLGLGIHIWLLSPSLPVFLHLTTRITQSLYGCYLAYATAITLVKASIIVSYLRIFPNITLRRFMLSTDLLVLLMWICSIFVIVFECVPVSAAWDWTEQGRCIDILPFFYIASSVNIATDVVLWFAPLPVFWGMNMRRGERIMVCGLFGFGFFAVIASILRLAQLHVLHSKDITYTSVPSLSWSVAEVSTAILCACIPSMRPLASLLLPKTFLSSLVPSSHHTKPDPSTGLSPAAAFELAQSPRKNRYATEGDEDGGEGDWAELGGSGSGSGNGWGSDGGKGMEESVGLKDMLREGRDDRGREVMESPLVTPGAGKTVGTEEKI